MSNRPLKNKKKVMVEEEVEQDHEVEYRSPGRTGKDLIIQIGVTILICSFFLAPMLVFVFSPTPQPAQPQQQQQPNDTEEQIKRYSAELKEKPNDPTVLANLGFYTTEKAMPMLGVPEQENLGKTLLKESEGYLRKALEQDADFGFAQTELAKNLIFQKNFDEAQSLIDQALSKAEGNLTSSDTKVAADAKAQKAQMMGFTAHILQEKGDVPGAIAKFNEVVELNPGNPQLYMNRATLHLKNNDKDSARKDYQTMVDIGQKTQDKNAVMFGQALLEQLDKPAPSATPGGSTTPAAGGTPVSVATPAAGGQATPVTASTPTAPATP